MPFRCSDRHVEEYYHHGYTVFRGVLPPALVGDLRLATEAVRAVARERHGPQAQRLQPLSAYGDRIDLGPFHAYDELPELLDAVQRVLSPRHTLAGLSQVAVLVEPAERPWCTLWHRDITATTAAVAPEEFHGLFADDTFFTQSNCALWTDTCTWYVPASDGRPDLAGEREAAAAMPTLDGLSDGERERACVDYARSMPGAVQLVLEPGDFCLYRPNGWHLGTYTPYRKRATLHDAAWKPETRAWYRRWAERREELRRPAG